MKVLYMSRKTYYALWDTAYGILATPPDLHYDAYLAPFVEETNVNHGEGVGVECLWDDRLPYGHIQLGVTHDQP